MKEYECLDHRLYVSGVKAGDLEVAASGGKNFSDRCFDELGVSYTPLGYAASHSKPELLKELLRIGADPSATNEAGEDALFQIWSHLHFTGSRLPMLEMLKTGGADVAACVNQGSREESLLHRTVSWVLSGTSHPAVVKQGLEMMEWMLGCGLDVDNRDVEGRTALHIVAKDAMNSYREKALSVAKLLLKKGAKVDAIDDNGWTPLLLAADIGTYKLCKMLLENGANPLARLHSGMSIVQVCEGDDYLAAWLGKMCRSHERKYLDLELSPRPGQPVGRSRRL